MSLYAALNTAVAGLGAQSSALENISGNIANSSTTGFKRVDTAFVDLVTNYTYTNTAQTSGSVLSSSQQTNTVAGVTQSSDTSTHMAVSGDGYFVVYAKTGEVDGRPIFDEVPYYTRRGDFSMDEDGYLVNEAGYYLAVIELDSTTGNPVSSVPQPVVLDEGFMEADATTAIEYTGNLPAYPQTGQADENVAGSELLDVADYTVDPTTGGAGVVQANSEETFLGQSIMGGAITTYTANGETVNVQMRWAKIADSPDTWNMFYMSDSSATGTDAKWTNVGQDYVFDSSGNLSPTIPSVTIAAMTIDGENLGNIDLIHSGDGLTSYATSNGVANVNISQDGAAAGELVKISISDAGNIQATYTNGKSESLAEIPLASFDGDNFLAREDGGAFRATEDSGEAILGATGSIKGSALESSNVDIADEFSKMIVTQQAYSANTRVLSTSQDMLQEIMQVIR